ncbi:MAG: O-antigen ligase family protein [Patescibacteria group bacterium]
MKTPLLAKISRVLIYLTALVPLIIFAQYISPFHFGKAIVFRSIIELLVVVYGMLVITDRSYAPRMHGLTWAILAFTAAFGIATATSVVPWASFWGSLERMGGFFSFLHFTAFVLIVPAVLRERAHWTFFLNLLIAGGMLSALYGFGQKLPMCTPGASGICALSSWFIGGGGRERIFGTIGNAALFAGYQISMVSLALALFVRGQGAVWERRLYQAMVGLGLLAITMTVVRGSLLGVGVATLMFTAGMWWKFRETWSRNILISVLSLATLLGFLIFVPALKDSSLAQGSRFMRRLTDTSFDSYTAKTRFWAWDAGIQGWQESPKTIMLGWGPENFNIPFAQHFNPQFFRGYGSETFFDRAHNMFVEVLVTMGLLGFGSYIALFATLFWALYYISQRDDASWRMAWALGSGTVAYMIHSAFIFDTTVNWLLFFIIFSFVAWERFGSSLIVPRRLFAAHWAAPTAGVLLSIIACALVWTTAIVPAKANRAITWGIVYGWNDDFPRAVSSFKEGIGYDTIGLYEYRHRFAQFLLDNVSRFSPLGTQFTDAMLYAVTEVEKNKIKNKHDYLPLLYLSRLYVTLGKDDPASPWNDKAIENATAALELSETFVRTYYEIGQAYLNKNDYETGVAWFKKAAELNPDVAVSYWYVGAVELERGNKNVALEYFEEAFNHGYVGAELDYNRVVPLYNEFKNYDRLVQIFEELVKLQPTDAQYRVSLSAAYASAGRIDDALQAAREAVKLNPELIDEARAFARSLGREL